jgi:hypothetical protein
MDYITHYYKNRTLQLQQELEQLTETYEYRLNEAGGLGSVIRGLFGFGDDVARAVPKPRPGIAAGAAAQTPAMTAAQREAAARAAREAQAAAAAAYAQSVREARAWVLRNMQDVPPGGFAQWARELRGAQREAYDRLFGHIPGAGNNPHFPRNVDGSINYTNGPDYFSIRKGDKDYIFRWDDASDGWIPVGRNVETPFGNTGNNGFVPVPQKVQVSSMFDTVDSALQNTQLASTRPGIGSNGSGLGSNGSGLGSVAALYMSYDPRAVSRKINYITEKYYRY